MCGLEWGRLYEEYHRNAYDPNAIHEQVQELFDDPFIKNKKGVFEYILGGCKNTQLLDIRFFTEDVKRKAYRHQTKDAKMKKISNCPLCAISNSSNKAIIYDLKEMDADHVTAWSKGGSTDISNCEMLCKTHNRAKGNK